MRAMWKGSISFGLVNIPVKMFAATEKKNLKFRNLHHNCNTPLEYRKVCPKCQQEVENQQIVKGYEYEQGRFVIITDDDLKKIPDKTTKTIDIVDFIELTEIDPVFYDATYYLTPADAGEKAYNLLQEVMAKTGKIAVASLTIRSKQSLAALRTYNKILAVETMYYPAEVRDTANLPEWNYQTVIHDHEMKMALELVNNLTAPFEPEKYKDNYRQELMNIIQAKVAGAEVTEVEDREQGKVVDLMEALKASVNATGNYRGSENDRELAVKK